MAKLHPQTGPVTVEGKQTASRNATTHGGTSEQLIVPGERREDFDELLNDLLAEHSPSTPQACHLVEDMALARWLLWRKQRAVNIVESNLYKEQPAPEQWSPEAWHKLALLDRYKTAAERSLQRAIRNLQMHIREARRAPKEETQAMLALAHQENFFKESEQSQWKAAYNGFDCPTAVQNITVHTTHHGVEMAMNPTNAALLRDLEFPTPYPAEKVVRNYYFPRGVPEEYYALTSREGYRLRENHTIEHTLAVCDWRELIEAERALGTGHCLLNPKGDSVS
jgi:hypothetical protein